MKSHVQELTSDQDSYISKVQSAFVEKRGTRINKSKAGQMIIDWCRLKNIKPEDFIK